MFHLIRRQISFSVRDTIVNRANNKYGLLFTRTITFKLAHHLQYTMWLPEHHVHIRFSRRIRHFLTFIYLPSVRSWPSIAKQYCLNVMRTVTAGCCLFCHYVAVGNFMIKNTHSNHSYLIFFLNFADFRGNIMNQYYFASYCYIILRIWLWLYTNFFSDYVLSHVYKTD